MVHDIILGLLESRCASPEKSTRARASLRARETILWIHVAFGDIELRYLNIVILQALPPRNVQNRNTEILGTSLPQAGYRPHTWAIH